MDNYTAGRTPAEGLSYPYPMTTDTFPGSVGSEDLDHVFYVNENNHLIHSKQMIFPISHLNSAIYQCTVNNPQEEGDFTDTLTAELRDETDTVTSRITCGVFGQLTLTLDDDGAVTSALVRATCDDIVFENLATVPVIDCNSQRIVRNDYATLLFTDFIRLYPDGVSGSGVNYPPCPGRVRVIS